MGYKTGVALRGSALSSVFTAAAIGKPHQPESSRIVFVHPIKPEIRNFETLNRR